MNGDITNISETTDIDFNINHDNLLFDSIPSALRIYSYDEGTNGIVIYKAKYFKYLQVVFESLTNMWLSFLNYRKNTIQQTRISGQRIVLEKWLQIKFSNPNIQIVSATLDFAQVYIFRRSENVNTYLFRDGETPTSPQPYLFRKDEATLKYDFTVKVPVELINTGVTIDQLNAEVEKYKFLGSLYTIVVI